MIDKTLRKHLLKTLDKLNWQASDDKEWKNFPVDKKGTVFIPFLENGKFKKYTDEQIMNALKESRYCLSESSFIGIRKITKNKTVPKQLELFDKKRGRKAVSF